MTVSHPVVPAVVTLEEEEMMVDSGGKSDKASGIPCGYNVSSTSAFSDDLERRACCIGVWPWTRWWRVYSLCWWISVSTIESV